MLEIAIQKALETGPFVFFGDKGDVSLEGFKENIFKENISAIINFF